MKKEEIMDQVNVLLKEMVELLKQGKQFAEEEIPLVLQEFLTWELTSSIMWIVVGIIFFLVGRYLPYAWLYKEQNNADDDKFFNRYCNRGKANTVTAFIFFIILGAIGACITISNLFATIKIIIAPRVYLIEWANSLIS